MEVTRIALVCLEQAKADAATTADVAAGLNKHKDLVLTKQETLLKGGVQHCESKAEVDALISTATNTVVLVQTSYVEHWTEVYLFDGTTCVQLPDAAASSAWADRDGKQDVHYRVLCFAKKQKQEEKETVEVKQEQPLPPPPPSGEPSTPVAATASQTEFATPVGAAVAAPTPAAPKKIVRKRTVPPSPAPTAAAEPKEKKEKSE